MLRSRNQFPPLGFLFIQPETGWEAPKHQSFTVTAKAIQTHRLANPGLAKKHGWKMDLGSIEDELDLFNTRRCVSRGWWNYITEPEGTISPKTLASPSLLKNAVGGVKRVAAGVKTLLDWLGSGAHPVDRSVAEQRAVICVACPQNGHGDWTSYFTKPAAEEIRQQLEIRNSLKLETPSDVILGVCRACSCPLKLKVWTPMNHILANTEDEVRNKLDKDCWILKSQA